MKKAQERLEREAKESQELPLEDAKGEETVGQESKEERLRLEDAPKERSSPAQIESRSDRASQDHPKTSPAAITPARPGSTASAPGQANPGDSQPGTVRTPATIEGRRKEETNRRSVGDTGGRKRKWCLDCCSDSSQSTSRISRSFSTIVLRGTSETDGAPSQ